MWQITIYNADLTNGCQRQKIPVKTFSSHLECLRLHADSDEASRKQA